MILIYASLLFFAASGFLALLTNRVGKWAVFLGVAGAVGGACSGILGLIVQFIHPSEIAVGKIGGILFQLDLLSTLFLLPVFVIGMLAAIYSVGYRKGHTHGRSGFYWFFFNMTLFAMTLVALMASPITFLFAWELMGLMSFALVAFDYKSRENMYAAWVYLLACQGGAACLILMFVLSGKECSWVSLDAVLFLIGAVGFGLKAGFPLLHVWLPEAHPAAPAPVSAVMSGAMLNLGLYGILRIIVFPEGPLLLYGNFFLCVGLLGALIGVFSALAQKNIKRLLAYSSIENIGIICMGLGFGFLGTANADVVMAVFGFSGAFLHLLNHSVLKGALFLASGEVFRTTGILDVDRLGGLMKRLPWVGGVFSFMGISLSGLPPFNGFLGEFLIYMAAFAGIAGASGWIFGISLASVILLALVGGIAAGVFVKAIGGIFLGEPRSEQAANAEPACRSILFSLTAFLLLAFTLSILAPAVCRILAPLIQHFTGLPAEDIASQLQSVSGILLKLGLMACTVFVFFALLAVLRSVLPRGREEQIRGTWDCGYAKPSPRMEYTGTALVQPLCDYFSGLTHFRKKVMPPEGLFPAGAKITVETDDSGMALIWRPVFGKIAKFAEKIHVIQSGYLHLYLLMIIATLIAVLLWGFVFSGSLPDAEVSADGTESIVPEDVTFEKNEENVE